MTDTLSTLSHVSHLSAILGTPVHVATDDSGFQIGYLNHTSSDQPLVTLGIEADGYHLTVNTADGSDNPVTWATICVAIIYGAQNDIVCKLDDCGRITEIKEVV